MTAHGLSFDVEDWHQLESIRVDGAPGPASPTVDDCLARILALCDEAGVKATFFVLGLLARERPHLVKEIAARGHEIGSHSVRHRLVHALPAGELRDDLRESKQLLEDLTGTEVIGFRAPEFSVQRLDHPCFAALVEAGFRYDSSVFPAPGLRYGIPGAPHVPFRIATSAGPLVELPLATARIARWRLPIAGGSHLRVLPTPLVTWAAARADLRREPLVFYFHPYEFATELLRLPGGWARNRPIAKHLVLHNLGGGRIRRSLRALTGRLDFVPLRALAEDAARPEIAPDRAGPEERQRRTVRGEP
jgi:polysaccharide deacetylase family protein (PEP-CTERM system associated)